MDIIKKFKKAAREGVGTPELFTSSYMEDYIGAKLRLITKAFRVACPRLRIMHDEQSDVTACTSLDDMIINSGHMMFDGDDELRLLKVSGVLLHEIGHILFTNFTAWRMWEENIKAGVFFPQTPEVSPDDEDARDKLPLFAKEMKYQNAFISISHNLSNCLEDGRIEGIILKSIRNARFMTKGLVRLRQETWAECPSFEELQSGVDSGDMVPVGAVLQLAIHYARFGEIKGKLDKTSSLGEIITKMIPEIDVYLEAKDAIVCYDAFNKMLTFMEPLIEDLFEQMEEQQEDGSDKEDSSDQGQGTSDEEIEKALKDVIEPMLEQLVGKTIDNSDSMSDDAKGTDRSSVKKALSGLASGSKEDPEEEEACEDGTDKGTISHEDTSLPDSNVNLTLEDIARRIADDAAEQMASSEVKAEYSKVAKEIKDYNSIHKHRDITIFHYPSATDEEVMRYNEIATAIAPLVKKAVKGSNFYEKDRQAVVEGGLFSGTTLHAEQVYRGDGKIFSQRYDHKAPPQVALAIRIDCSGSMSGERIKAAQRACVFLYEYAIGMEKKYNVKIPLYIYGDCTQREAHGVNMYVFADDKFRTPTEKYRLMKLAAGGANRDGLPIRMAVKRLEDEHPHASKVVFNITDGKPADEGYSGPPAWDDLRDITRHCEKKRIALAACAIGNDKDRIEEIYGSNHFLNISDLNELPVRLVKILKKLLK